MIGYDTNHAATLEAWIHATNRLTLKKAQQVAESAMRAVGVRPQTLGKPREKTQLTIWRPTGPPAPLPYYKFRWEKGNASCDIHVSGITSNIVHFSCSGCLQPAVLTNYLELLGLRSDTVFVRRRATFPPTYELW